VQVAQNAFKFVSTINFQSVSAAHVVCRFMAWGMMRSPGMNN